MEKRTLNLILTVCFCAAIFAAPLLFFLLPRQEVSQKEKRYLAAAPEFSLRDLVDGSFISALEEYVTDHFPGRELFVGINAYYDLLSGRQATKDYFLADGRLFAQPVEVDEQKLAAHADTVDRFCRDLREAGWDIPVSLMLVPSSGSVLLEDKDYPDERVIAAVYAGSEANCVDLMELFRSNARPGELYYRTDHHWTSKGAYKALCAYCQSLGRSAPGPYDYQVERVEDFYGSAYAGSGLWLTAPDKLELWDLGSALHVSNESGGGNESVFYPQRLDEMDKYTVFLDGNHSLVRIENPAPKGEGGKLLVIRDSFSNCLGCFLADLYDEVILVDLRYYRLPLTTLLQEEEVDEVLIEYSVDNFLNDPNLALLSIRPEELRREAEVEKAPNYYAPPREISETMFDNAFYLGDSVIGTLEAYCVSNHKLSNTLISTNAMLSMYHIVDRINKHFQYQGHSTTLSAALRDMQPSVLICALGCNDLATNGLDYTKKVALRFLDVVRRELPDVTIFMQSVMPIRGGAARFTQGDVDVYNAFLRENAEAYDYCYIELASYFKAQDGQLRQEYMRNATHINQAGGELWYRELMNGENYYHFPEKFYVEYDGETGQPVEESSGSGESAAAPSPTAAPASAREESELDRLYQRIADEFALPEMMELSGRTVTDILGLRAGDYRDARFYLCANNLKADEIWLIRAESESAASTLLTLAQERLETKAQSYDGYLPEESRLIRRGLAVSRGCYVGLFISPEAESMKELFLRELPN